MKKRVWMVPLDRMYHWHHFASGKTQTKCVGKKHARTTVSGIPGMGLFFSEVTPPFSRKHVYCCFGVFFVSKLRFGGGFLPYRVPPQNFLSVFTFHTAPSSSSLSLSVSNITQLSVSVFNFLIKSRLALLLKTYFPWQAISFPYL